MRLQDILSMTGSYMGIGLVFLIVVLVGLVVGYQIVYKKLCKGKRKINFKKFFWWFILVFYLFVVISVTLLSRPGHIGFGNGQIVSSFYSYKEAWVSASETAWRNIILNILMFVPLGFWLPVGKKAFRSFWKTYLVGLLLTVGIEVLQLLLSRGIFEVADVFNNTLGTMIGYGVYKVIEYFILLHKKEKPKLSVVMFSQLPLVLAVAMFMTIFLTYQKQELGNLQIEYILPYEEGRFQIVSEEEYNKDTKKAMVYQTDILTVEETEQLAACFFKNLGTTVDTSRNDIYENTAVYWSNDSYSMWIDYQGGTYSMTDFDTSFPEEGEEEPLQVKNASKETIWNALAGYGIQIPEEADFSSGPDGGYVFTVDLFEADGVIYDGVLECDYYDNGKFASIRNNIRKMEPYKEFDICSEREAYEQILAGKFVGIGYESAKIEIGQVSLDYMQDTKGFYQPVYNFDIQIEGEEQSIQIPAIPQ
ncbi:MAG: VanZ family protein [Lachnospiraceae bacterium]|nr:VanZ family protein [Lachnospiraceae bacterium]